MGLFKNKSNQLPRSEEGKGSHVLDITKEHCPMTFVKTKIELSKLQSGDIVSEAKITSTNSFKLLKKWQILICSAV